MSKRPAVGTRAGSVVGRACSRLGWRRFLTIFRAASARQRQWCLLLVLFRQGFRGGSGPQRLTRALGIETGNPIMTYEQRSNFFPSTERAPHHTSTRIPCRRCSFASTSGLVRRGPPLQPITSLTSLFVQPRGRTIAQNRGGVF